FPSRRPDCLDRVVAHAGRLHGACRQDEDRCENHVGGPLERRRGQHGQAARKVEMNWGRLETSAVSSEFGSLIWTGAPSFVSSMVIVKPYWSRRSSCWRNRTVIRRGEPWSSSHTWAGNPVPAEWFAFITVTTDSVSWSEHRLA